MAAVPRSSSVEKAFASPGKKLARKLSRKVEQANNRPLNQCLKHLQHLLRSCARTTTAERGGALALTTLRGAFQQVLAARRTVVQSDTKTIHRLRVAFKRFRYMNELLDGFLTFPPGRLEEMKNYQDLTGDVQDWEVLLNCVNRLVESGEIGRGAVKRLCAEIARRRRSAIERFVKGINTFSVFEPERPATGQT